MDAGVQTLFFESLINRGTLPALERMVAFTQARHEMLAENIANIDTPGYARKRLDPEAFQASLKEAMDRVDALSPAQKRTGRALLDLRRNAQFATNLQGDIEVKPEIEPAENILLHDGTNARLETLMSEVADNALSHQFIMNQLHGRYEGVLKAIRGRI